MPYMGRGGISSFGGNVGNSGNEVGKDEKNNDTKDATRMYLRGMLFRRYYYIPLDNTYVVLQMIATILILVVAGITFLSKYKPSIIDPIESTKKIIINAYLITNLILISAIVMSNYFSKNKKELLKKLTIILAISMITVCTFLGIKLKMDMKYTKSQFEQIYDSEYVTKPREKNQRISIGLKEIGVKTEKEYYADECMKCYKIFDVKLYGIIGINTLIITLLIYQIYKVTKIKEKLDKLEKDDIVVYDEEENVKM